MKKVIALFVSLILLVSLLCSCGSNASLENTSRGEAGSYGIDDSRYSPSKPIEENSDGNGDIQFPESGVSRKVIKHYSLSLETLKYPDAVAQITAQAEAFGGYVSASSLHGKVGDSRYATFTVRIPAALAEDYLDAISNDCNVLNSSLSTDDITDSYYDIKSSLESYEKQEIRLMEMMEKAETLDYMLQIEDKLTWVRSQISSLNYQLQLMDKSVDYSYVNITLSEVKVYQEVSDSFWQKLGAAFTGAFTVFVNVLQGILLIIVRLWPFLLVAAIVTIIICFVNNRRIKRRALRKKAEQKENTESK